MRKRPNGPTTCRVNGRAGTAAEHREGFVQLRFHEWQLAREFEYQAALERRDPKVLREVPQARLRRLGILPSVTGDVR